MILHVAAFALTLPVNGAAGGEIAFCAPSRGEITVEDVVDGRVVAIPSCEPTPAQVLDAYKSALGKLRAMNTQLQASNDETKRELIRLQAVNQELRERLDRIERIVDPAPVRPQ